MRNEFVFSSNIEKLREVLRKPWLNSNELVLVQNLSIVIRWELSFLRLLKLRVRDIVELSRSVKAEIHTKLVIRSVNASIDDSF
jgi:hypothetical protein